MNSVHGGRGNKEKTRATVGMKYTYATTTSEACLAFDEIRRGSRKPYMWLPSLAPIHVIMLGVRRDSVQGLEKEHRVDSRRR